MLILKNNHADNMYTIELIKNFDDLELPEYTDHGTDITPGARFTYNWRTTEDLFRAALIWACGEAIAKIDHLSDSHVDDQYCLARFILQMTDILYDYDQTRKLPESIQTWLDDDDAIDDLIYVAMMLNGQSAATTPLLFDHFKFTETDY